MGNLIPRELTSKNIRDMILKCRVRPTTTNPVTTYIFYERAGFSENGIKYEFDQDILNDQFETILYMAGQLKDSKNKSGELTLENFPLTYQDTIWISMDNLQGERNDVYDLIALLTTTKSQNGESVAVPFIAGIKNILASKKYLKPTLSPEDPNYVDPRK